MDFLLKEKRPLIPWSPHFLGPREKPNMQYTVMGQSCLHLKEARVWLTPIELKYSQSSMALGCTPVESNQWIYIFKKDTKVLRQLC